MICDANASLHPWLDVDSLLRSADVWGFELSREQQDVSPGHGSRQTLHARGKS